MATRNSGQSPGLAGRNGYDPTVCALWNLSLALKEISEGPIMEAEKEEPPGQFPGEDELPGGGEGDYSHGTS